MECIIAYPHLLHPQNSRVLVSGRPAYALAVSASRDSTSREKFTKFARMSVYFNCLFTSPDRLELIRNGATSLHELEGRRRGRLAILLAAVSRRKDAALQESRRERPRPDVVPAAGRLLQPSPGSSHSLFSELQLHEVGLHSESCLESIRSPLQRESAGKQDLT